MTSECHSVVRAPAMRVTALDQCGAILDQACSNATEEGFVQITLSKVFQDRQDALRLNANGDICVDKPKEPILRWYTVTIEFCNVHPELLNIITAEPLVLDDSVSPVAVGWDTVVGSAALSNFGLEFWTGTEDDECDNGLITYAYGLLPWVRQANLTGDIVVGNDVVTFTVEGITKAGSQWGVGPYTTLINQTGVNAGFPGPELTAIGPLTHKRFHWTTLPPPDGVCGCNPLSQELDVTPLAGAAPLNVTATIPLDTDGNPIPGFIDWGDATAPEAVATATAMHAYAAPGTYNATYYPTGYSSPAWVSQDIVVS